MGTSVPSLLKIKIMICHLCGFTLKRKDAVYFEGLEIKVHKKCNEKWKEENE